MHTLRGSKQTSDNSKLLGTHELANVLHPANPNPNVLTEGYLLKIRKLIPVSAACIIGFPLRNPSSSKGNRLQIGMPPKQGKAASRLKNKIARLLL